MSHYVICAICQERFNRDRIQAIKISARRYAHAQCAEDSGTKGELMPVLPQKEKKKTEEKEKKEVKQDEDLVKLNEYVFKLFGKDTNWARVKQQIKEYTEKYHYSYSGILKSLVYFYDVKKNSITKANNSIGIVPFVYQDAFNYYYALWQAQEINKTKNITITPRVKEVTIKPPIVNKKLRLFFNDEEDN